MPKNYTVKEVADILGFSTNSIYTFLKEKRLHGVRIGKGRFRIPEEELSRVLHLSKKPIREPAVTPNIAEIITRPVASFAGDAALLTKKEEISHTSFAPPNIFDWFVGLAAIVSGLGLFLFNSLFGNAQVVPFMGFIMASRFVLMASGIGVIVATMAKGSGPWRKVFYVILSLLGLINALLLLRGGDVDGAIIYGGLAAVSALGIVVSLGGIVSIGSYLSSVAILIPIAIFLFPADHHFVTLAKTLGITTTVLGSLVSVISSCFLIFFWSGYLSQPLLFAFVVVLASMIQFGGAIFYGIVGLWSRSFFLVVVGFFTAALPVWRSIQVVCSPRQRTALHLVFMGVGGMLCLALLVVSLLQQSIWQQNKNEFLNKISAATHILTTTVASIESSITVAAANPDFIAAIAKKDTGELARLGKIVYESNPDIRRLVFLDAAGDGLALYPYGTFDQPNFAGREYFTKARDTQRPYVSNLFRSLADRAGRFVVVISVPVFRQNHEFVGVITASVDLDKLGFALQQIAVQTQGEYFVIVDSENKILFHPNSTLVGTDLSTDDVIRKGVAGEKDVVQSTLPDGTAGMIGYASVPDLHWAVSLQVPATRVFDLQVGAVVTIFGVVASVMTTALVFLSFFQAKWCALPKGGGGP